MRCLEAAVRHRAEQDAGAADLPHRAVAAQQRRRVAAAGHGQPRAVDQRADERHRAQPRLLDEDLVDEVQDRAGLGIEARRGPHRVADEARQRGGGDPLAGHVAEEREVAAAAGSDDVVEVAADLGALLARLIGGGAEPVRAARAAARAAGSTAACARPAPGPRRGGRSGSRSRLAGRDPGRTRSRCRVKRRPLSAVISVSAPSDLLPRPHRHDHHAAHPERADRLELLGVGDRLREQLVRDVA